MFRYFLDTFFISRSALSASRRRHYLTALLTISVLHVAGCLAAWYFTPSLTKPDEKQILILCSLLQLVSLASGFFLFVLSLKSEVLVSQTYEFAAAATQSASHQFRTFTSHLEWLLDNLTPERYPNAPVHLYTSISTPLYGIADGHQAAELYLRFFEAWVAYFEGLPADVDETPVWELAVWNQEDNRAIFNKTVCKWDDPESQRLLTKYAVLLARIWDCHKANKLELRLYFTDPSHSRLFMVKAGRDRYCGLVVMFTPLTAATIQNNGWSLVGFSFHEARAYSNIVHFNRCLQNRHLHAQGRRSDESDALADPAKWLRKHYEIKDQQNGKQGKGN